MATKLPIHITAPPTYLFLGVPMTLHLSGDQTGGEFSLIEGIMPPGGDGGLHIHTREDETLHLIDGELHVTLGDQQLILTAGQSYFAPRGLPHRVQNLGTQPARAMLINTPGTFDGFVREAGIPIVPGAPLPPAPSGPPTPEQIQHILALAEKYGVQVLAPPGA